MTRGSQQGRPFFRICCWVKSRKWDFSCLVESGSSKQKHLAATQSKAGRLQLPKSSFNGWNHESRHSVFQTKSMSPGSCWFFMPVSTVFTVKKRGGQSSFLPFLFFFFLRGVFATFTYLNNRESSETIKVWFNRCFHSPFTVLSDTTEKLFLLSYCNLWRADPSCRLNFLKYFYNVLIFWNAHQEKLI